MTQNMTHTPALEPPGVFYLLFIMIAFMVALLRNKKIFFLDLPIILQEGPFKLRAVHLGTSVSGPLLRMLNYWSLNGLIIV